MQLTEPRAEDERKTKLSLPESWGGGTSFPSRPSPGTLQALARGGGGRWVRRQNLWGWAYSPPRAALTLLRGLPSLSLSRVCERAEQGHSGQLQDRASWCWACLFSPSGPWGRIKDPISHVRCGTLFHKPKAVRSHRQKSVLGPPPLTTTSLGKSYPISALTFILSKIGPQQTAARSK